MKTLMLSCVTLVAIAGFSAMSSPLQAADFAIHVSGPGYHVGLGRPHYRNVYYGARYGHYNDYYGYYGGHVWHDTSHYDYHPGEFVRHRNHYHYVPGHYDYHETGHVDHYHW